MENIIDKKGVLQACILKQQELIDGYANRTADLKADAFNRNASASQSEPRQGSKLDMLNAMEKELVFATKELHYLNALDIASESDSVKPGAVVVTDRLTFFIGVSSEKISLHGKTIFGISTKAPIYSVMEGLREGDSFEFNGEKYLITGIY